MKFGKRGYPVYRIVALDKRKKRDGAYIEKIGLYQPMSQNKIEITKARYDYWIQNGAQLSDGLRRLLKNKQSVLFQ